MRASEMLFILHLRSMFFEPNISKKIEDLYAINKNSIIIVLQLFHPRDMHTLPDQVYDEK
jgi:hypothetical protein